MHKRIRSPGALLASGATTLLILLVAGFFVNSTFAQTNAPAPQGTNAANAAPPPSAPAKRSQSDLEKLVAPIALYPDPLIATLLPASAYPLEIVQAARFVKNTNNIAKLDSQPWDDNVKDVARVPQVISQMDSNISWTIDLGEAFINQPKEIMEAIQTMRGKAQESGALKTTEQQIVVVTNQIIQIQPSQPEVIYVPQYNPTVVYSGYPVYYPGYYYPPPPPVGSALVGFGVGIAVGAIVANNCDWHGGGVYVGHHGVAVWGGGGHHSDVDIDVDRNVNIDNSFNRENVNAKNRQTQNTKWQPDQARRQTSAGTSYTGQNREARGWSGSNADAAKQHLNQTRSSGTSPQNTANRAQTGARPQPSQPAARPTTTQNRSASTPSAAPRERPAASPSTTQRSSSARSTPSGGGSAFNGMNSGSSARSESQRGSVSRGGGGSVGRGGGGGGRGGGGRR